LRLDARRGTNGEQRCENNFQLLGAKEFFIIKVRFSLSCLAVFVIKRVLLGASREFEGAQAQYLTREEGYLEKNNFGLSLFN